MFNHGELNMKKFTVTLTKDERTERKKISSRGKHRSQKFWTH